MSVLGSLLILAMTWVPGAQGDVAIVPGVFIEDYTMTVDLTITENGTDAEIGHEFDLVTAANLDSSFSLNVNAGEDMVIGAEIKEPEGTNITIQDNRSVSMVHQMYTEIPEQHFLYNYSLHFENAGGITLHRAMRSMDGSARLWTIHSLVIKDFSIVVTANMNVTVFNGTWNRTGSFILLNYSELEVGGWDSWNGYYFESETNMASFGINWTEGENVVTVFEWLKCTIIDPHLSGIPDLIDNEFIEVKVTETDGVLDYGMNCTFHLNWEIIYWLSPVYLWFPENGTKCEAVLSYSSTNWISDGDGKGHNISWSESMKLESYGSTRWGQDGFYIFIPDLRTSSVHSNVTLNVLINGTLRTPLFDFVIVTVPIGESSINITYPSVMRLTVLSSPFTVHSFSNATFEKSVQINGTCLRMEVVHIEWEMLEDTDGDGVPDEDDDFPNDPLRWENDGSTSETITRSYTPILIVFVILIGLLAVHRIPVGRK